MLKLKLRCLKIVDGVVRHGIIKTTLGKLIFNESIPQDLGFIDRSKSRKWI